MSRTDAHVPWWVRAPWYEPVHHLYCPNVTHNRFWQKRSHTEPCTLPERPVRHSGGRTRVYVPLCAWRPVHPGWRQSRRIYGNTVPRWYMEHVWHNPERVRVRDGLTKICKEYNAGIRDDWDFPNHQARHGATWYWD